MLNHLKEKNQFFKFIFFSTFESREIIERYSKRRKFIYEGWDIFMHSFLLV